MKKLIATSFFLLAILATRANLLFSDGLNYPDGQIESKGLWYCYTPAAPYQDAFVTNHLLILNPANHDGVAVPTNGVVNPSAPSVVYASFTINVSQLPSLNGGYFCEFLDPSTTNAAARIFIDSRGTAVPGTYRLGVANYNTSITAVGSTNFPVDLAPGVTYQVVMSWDETSSALGATLWVNPSSENDAYVFGSDTTNGYLATMPVGSIAFSQYGAYSAIGNVMIGTQFSDVMTNVAQLPVFGIQPQGTTNYAGYNMTLYSAASGMDVTYQWLSNNVPLTDDGVTVVGSQSNILNLTNLQDSANYSVVATDSAGSVTSAVAVVSINTTPTAPFFTLQPQSQTNSLGGTINLAASASGTGPITYQWYFAPTNSGSYSLMSGQTGSTLTLSSLNFSMSGTYYVTATGISSQNSSVATVLVIPPPTVSLAYLHSFLTLTPPNTTNLNNGTIYNVQGVVASIGAVLSKTYSEYSSRMEPLGQSGLFINGTGATNVPPAGTLVTLTGMARLNIPGSWRWSPMSPTTSIKSALSATIIR